MELRNKVALITGGNRGIGEGIAKAFSKEGASLAICARDIAKLKQVKQDLEQNNVDIMISKTDMRNRDEIEDMVNRVYKQFGQIDILVNNAGLPRFDYAIDDPDPQMEARYENIMNTNLRGYWYAARFVVPILKKQQHGSIINIGSVRGHAGAPNDSAYLAAKGAVMQLTRALAVELAPFYIRVNTISPGAIQVDIGHWVRSRFGDKAYQVYRERFSEIHNIGMTLFQPLRTIGMPEDVAHAAVFLASEKARFVTGIDLPVDGGETATLSEYMALDLKALHDFYEQSADMRAWLASLSRENKE